MLLPGRDHYQRFTVIGAGFVTDNPSGAAILTLPVYTVQGRGYTSSPDQFGAGVISGITIVQIGSHGTINAVKSQGRMVVVGSQAGAEVVGSQGRRELRQARAGLVTSSKARVDVGD
jgi:hypothetical protein